MQIGNAVPPILASVVAKAVLRYVNSLKALSSDVRGALGELERLKGEAPTRLTDTIKTLTEALEASENDDT